MFEVVKNFICNDHDFLEYFLSSNIKKISKKVRLFLTSEYGCTLTNDRRDLDYWNLVSTLLNYHGCQSTSLGSRVRMEHSTVGCVNVLQRSPTYAISTYTVSTCAILCHFMRKQKRIKIIYSEMATKFWEISTLLLTGTT